MRIIRSRAVVITALLIHNSCIDRYYIDEQVDFKPKLVFDCTITNETSAQEIILSKASPTADPFFKPYSGCIVEVMNDKNRIFSFVELGNLPGHYLGEIDKEIIEVGTNFRVQIFCPDGSHYISNYEEVLPSPPIDSCYYELSRTPTSDPEYYIEGVQFYLDFKTSNEYGQKYRYSLTESYEYHSTWPIRSHFDETGYVFSLDDYSKFVCYQTQNIADIYLLSTSNLTENTYIKYPLNFVSDQTQRLLYNYSLKITQYAISESDYSYWETLQKNNQESESLFTKQPSALEGNIYNAIDPNERALGYFGIYLVSTSRLVLKHIDELSYDEIPYCKPTFPYNGYPPWRPLYLVPMEHPEDPELTVMGYANSDCFDCTLHGGSLTKPEYFK